MMAPLRAVETKRKHESLAEKMLGILRLKVLRHPGEYALCTDQHIGHESRRKMNLYL